MRLFEREAEEGNVEFKLKLDKVDEARLEKLATQMKYRLSEGLGEAFYEVGVADSGEPIGVTREELQVTIENLRRAGLKISAACKILRVQERDGKFTAELLVRRSRNDGLPVMLTVPVLGNVDSGKSTTVGVLCSGELDDGNGLAMSKVARYIHEIKTRRTSSVVTRVLGFADDGRIVNYDIPSPLNEAEVFLNSSKIVTFVDVGGHERYLRTTLKGIMGHPPDYSMLVVGANAGVIGTCKEHLGIAVSLKLPVFVVVTKADMVSDILLERVLKDIERLLKMPAVGKIPILVRDLDDVVIAAKNMPCGRVSPVFVLSNKTGDGLGLLEDFLNLLPPRTRWSDKFGAPLLMYVDEKFYVKGAGVIASGVPLQGNVSVDERLQIGPFGDGSFRVVRVKSIHVNRVSVDRAFAGQEACLALSNVEYNEIRKGMCLLGEKLPPKATRSFEADITVLHHPTTIRAGYNAVVHLQTIRQTVRFERMSKPYIRSGDTANVEMAFMFYPEYVRVGDWFIFREGRTRGIGVVRAVPS